MLGCWVLGMLLRNRLNPPDFFEVQPLPSQVRFSDSLHRSRLKQLLSSVSSNADYTWLYSVYTWLYLTLLIFRCISRVFLVQRSFSADSFLPVGTDKISVVWAEEHHFASCSRWLRWLPLFHHHSPLCTYGSVENRCSIPFLLHEYLQETTLVCYCLSQRRTICIFE